GMTVQWWGILGLIGWAYGVASIVYVLVNNIKQECAQNGLLVAAIFISLFCWWLCQRDGGEVGRLIMEQSNVFTHSAIVLAGIVLSRLLYPSSGNAQIKSYGAYTLGMGLVAIILWQ